VTQGREGARRLILTPLNNSITGACHDDGEVVAVCGRPDGPGTGVRGILAVINSYFAPFNHKPTSTNVAVLELGEPGQLIESRRSQSWISAFSTPANPGADSHCRALTRQSIFFATSFLRGWMDHQTRVYPSLGTRCASRMNSTCVVKPAGDALRTSRRPHRPLRTRPAARLPAPAAMCARDRHRRGRARARPARCDDRPARRPAPAWP
jgi:hypothetical protein